MNPKTEGKAFEDLFETMAQLQGFRCKKVPEAGRWIGPQSFRPIKGMCDFIIIKPDSEAAFVDTKTTAGDTFTYSMIDQSQVKELKSVGDFCAAGYVIYFRGLNRVVFMPWFTLAAIGPNQSLSSYEGLYLGAINEFTIKEIFTCKWSGFWEP